MLGVLRMVFDLREGVADFDSFEQIILTCLSRYDVQHQQKNMRSILNDVGKSRESTAGRQYHVSEYCGMTCPGVFVNVSDNSV